MQRTGQPAMQLGETQQEALDSSEPRYNLSSLHGKLVSVRRAFPQLGQSRL